MIRFSPEANDFRQTLLLPNILLEHLLGGSLRPTSVRSRTGRFMWDEEWFRFLCPLYPRLLLPVSSRILLPRPTKMVLKFQRVPEDAGRILFQDLFFLRMVICLASGFARFLHEHKRAIIRNKVILKKNYELLRIQTVRQTSPITVSHSLHSFYNPNPRSDASHAQERAYSLLPATPSSHALRESLKGTPSVPSQKVLGSCPKKRLSFWISQQAPGTIDGLPRHNPKDCKHKRWVQRISSHLLAWRVFEMQKLRIENDS